MRKEEFIYLSEHCGYAKKHVAEKYVEENPKEEYTTDDFIAMCSSNPKRWEKCPSHKGLLPIYGMNGKTTAKRNGIADDSI